MKVALSLVPITRLAGRRGLGTGDRGLWTGSQSLWMPRKTTGDSKSQMTTEESDTWKTGITGKVLAMNIETDDKMKTETGEQVALFVTGGGAALTSHSS